MISGRRKEMLLVSALSLLLSACGGAPESTSAPQPAAGPDPPVDGHAHQPPHGGALVELGEHFAQLEIVVDSAAGTLTAYVLDAEAEQSIRIAQPSLTVVLQEPASAAGSSLTLMPVTSALTGETVGDASQFAAAAPALKGTTVLAGRVVEVVVKGQAFRDTSFRVE